MDMVDKHIEEMDAANNSMEPARSENPSPGVSSSTSSSTSSITNEELGEDLSLSDDESVDAEVNKVQVRDTL